MYYVLRTHGKINEHWGFACIGTFESKAKAKEHCASIMPNESYTTKLVIVKAIHLFKGIKVEFKDESLK